MARRNVMTRLNWDKIDADRLALLQRVTREHTRAVLRSMVAGQLASRGHPVRKSPDPARGRLPTEITDCDTNT
jgi:hypothetical protein